MLAAGIEYPRDTEAAPPTAEAAIAWLEAHLDQAFAVGEIGLDHYWVPESLWERQEAVFRRLVRLAIDANKAIIIHTRKAERRTLEVLLEEGATRVNWHCFSSKVKLAQQIAAAGHHLSIPANVRKAQNFQRMVMIPQSNCCRDGLPVPGTGTRRGQRTGECRWHRRLHRRDLGVFTRRRGTAARRELEWLGVRP